MSTWQTFSFYMPNALPQIVALQQEVFAALNEPLTQVRDTCSHGQFLTRTLRENIDQLDAVVFFDLDCIPLKPGVVERAVRLALKKEMLIGCAQQASHIEIAKIRTAQQAWPWWRRQLDLNARRVLKLLNFEHYRFTDPFIYAGPCFMVVPTKLYREVGQPDLNNTNYFDVAAQLTANCREHAKPVHILQPTHCHQLKFKLGNEKRYGLGTTYGNCVFHAFETTYLSNSKSATYFVDACQNVLRRYGAPAH